MRVISFDASEKELIVQKLIRVDDEREKQICFYGKQCSGVFRIPCITSCTASGLTEAAYDA
ncbi:MAG: hypothetical protein ACLUD2_12530 [Clostridium sp.]